MLGAGLAMLVGTWLPQRFLGRHVWLPGLYAAAGTGLYAAGGFGEHADPAGRADLVERLAELTVIVSLFGAGLAINRPLGLRTWREPLRLLLIGMPLTMLGVAVCGMGLLGAVPAGALLLAACLAPTDPVLAASVAVPDPGGEHEDPVRFPLSGEAALNDAAAFPFVYLAIDWLAAGGRWGDLGPAALATWAAWTLVGKIAVGVAFGAAAGWVAGRMLMPPGREMPVGGEHVGTIALGAVLVSYAGCEACGGYGFLAAFACGAAVRRQERRGERDHDLHEATETIERVLTGLTLFLFGAAAAHVWGAITTADWVAAAALVLLVRPAAAMASLAGLPEKRRVRLIVAFFGVRGVGSIYYLAYASGNEGAKEAAESLWPPLTAAVLLSLILHGTLAAPAVGWAARLDGRVAEPEAAAD